MKQTSHQIVIADDEVELCALLGRLVNKKGMRALIAYDGAAALELVLKETVDVLIVDYQLPDMNGLAVLKQAREIAPNLPVIMITAYADACSVMEARRAGIHHYLLKPFVHSELLSAIAQALTPQSIPSVAPPPSLREQMGPSEAVHRLISNVQRVAHSNFNVLIMGETGTGKELVAQAIHWKSRRRDGPFVAVDCGAIPEPLLESELFGHEKGAFSGATSRKIGKFELAASGTLFLDEISNLPLASQAKLLRVIQEKTIYRVGGVQPININVRIVAACNQNLEKIAEQGEFRSDLLFRLNEFTIKTLPLRERREDIPYLSQRFLEATNQELEKQVQGFSQTALSTLINYAWPGNVRQLRNIVRQAVLLADELVTAKDLSISLRLSSGEVMPPDYRYQCHLPMTTAPDDHGAINAGDEDVLLGQLSLKEVLRRHTAHIERQLIHQALSACHGNKAKAARLLQIDYKTMHTKVKEYSIKEIHHDEA